MTEPLELDSYQLAAMVASMDKQHTGQEIATQLGKSGAWVSRSLKTWKNATPALRKAWKEGLDYGIVRKISEFTPVKQPSEVMRCLAHPKRYARTRQIPGLDVIVKRFLTWDITDRPREYVRGMFAMARYVTGEISEDDFDEAWKQHKERA